MSQPVTTSTTEPSAQQFPVISQVEEELLMPNVIEPASLKSQHGYTCANHPNEEAFCLCAKCGNKLCRSCCVPIVGRRYCINCVVQDDNLRAAYDREMLRPRIFQAALEIQSVKAPQKLTDLPDGLRNMLTKTTIFFINARKSPFKLTFPMAMVALAPNSVVSLLYHLDTVVPQTEQYKQLYETLSAMPEYGRVAVALISTALQILLIDLVFFICAKAFTSSNMTYREAGSVMHYCLLPLVFSLFGTVFELPVISFISVILMIMLTTTASRASTQSTFFQSFGMMITFIVISTIFKLL